MAASLVLSAARRREPGIAKSASPALYVHARDGDTDLRADSRWATPECRLGAVYVDAFTGQEGRESGHALHMALRSVMRDTLTYRCYPDRGTERDAR
jgi:hypothetical protein